jgi:hypothetical protein
LFYIWAWCDIVISLLFWPICSMFPYINLQNKRPHQNYGIC